MHKMKVARACVCFLVYYLCNVPAMFEGLPATASWGADGGHLPFINLRLIARYSLSSKLSDCHDL